MRATRPTGPLYSEISLILIDYVGSGKAADWPELLEISGGQSQAVTCQAHKERHWSEASKVSGGSTLSIELKS